MNKMKDEIEFTHRRLQSWRVTMDIALVGGLVGGAIIAGAAAQQNAAAAQQQQQHVSYCAQRYRSYDPASDTFQGRDGRRYACQ